MNKFGKFIDYVHSFYGPDGVYPLGVTKDMITESTLSYVNQLEPGEFCGDSIDREKVRDIMIDDFDLSVNNIFSSSVVQ